MSVLKSMLTMMLIVGLSFSPVHIKYRQAMPEYVFRYAEAGQMDRSAVLSSQHFSNRVYAMSGGRIKILLYPDETLGNEQSIMDQLAFGGIDFGRIVPPSSGTAAADCTDGDAQSIDMDVLVAGKVSCDCYSYGIPNVQQLDACKEQQYLHIAGAIVASGVTMERLSERDCALIIAAAKEATALQGILQQQQDTIAMRARMRNAGQQEEMDAMQKAYANRLEPLRHTATASSEKGGVAFALADGGAY